MQLNDFRHHFYTKSWVILFFIFGVYSVSNLLKNSLVVAVALALQSCGVSSGFLSAAPIDNASCSIYNITLEGGKGDKLVSTISNKGVVEFNNVNYFGKALIECSAGGKYTDEATGEEKQSPMLRAALNFVEGEKFAVTPLTEIAVRIDTNLNNVIETHNSTVANAFGLSGKSITLIIPTNIDKTDITDDDAGDYAMVLAMLSKFEDQDVSNRGSLSEIMEAFKVELIDKTLDRATAKELVIALDGLDSKFKNTNADKIGANIVGVPLLTRLANLSTKNLIIGSPVTFVFENTGGDARSCGSEPSLPNGLIVVLFGGSCKIFGTPTLLQSATMHTIKATNLKGNSTATISISVNLDIPRNLKTTKGNAAVTLTWQAVNGATGYKIYYSQNEINASNLGSASVLLTSGVSGTVSGLSSGTFYHFVVAALQGSTEGPLSNTVTTTPTGKPILTNLPSRHFILNKNIIAFMFHNTGTAASSCSSEPRLPNGLIVESNNSNGGCEIFGTPTVLQRVTTYTIKATNAIGDDTATISINVDLDTIKSLTAQSKANAAVTLTWDTVSGATKYQVYYAKQSFNGVNLSNYASLDGGSLLQNITGTSKTIANLAVGTQYYFIVTAVKGTFESGRSGETTAIPVEMLNDTGIIEGGKYQTGNNDTCTGTEISAQDCSNGRDAQAAAGTLIKIGGGKVGFDFTKLGSTGNVLSIQNATWATGDTGTESAGTKWSCVRDNVTGLVWEVKSNQGVEDSDTTDNNHTNIHHQGNVYRWGGKTAIGRENANRKGDYNNDWTGLVEGTNAENFCGNNNWRVPTIGELYSIIDLSITRPMIDNNYFPNAVVNSFWSSSPYVNSLNNAWLLEFYDGYLYNYLRSHKSYSVRLVHSK